MKSKVKEVLDRYPGFEPSSDCKEKLLGTRKKPVEYGGIEYPGFFSVDDNLFQKRDKPAFISLLILEIIGIAPIFLISKPDPFTYLIKCILVGFLVLFEIFLAGYFHKNNYSNYVVAKNKLALIQNNEFRDEWSLSQKQRANSIINRHKIWSIACLVLLFVIAGAKTLITAGYEIKEININGEGIQFIEKMIPFIQLGSLLVFFAVAYLLWMSYGYYRNYRSFFRCFLREADEHREGIEKFKSQYKDFLVAKSARPVDFDCYAFMKRTRRQSWNEKIDAKLLPFDFFREGSLLSDHADFFDNKDEIYLLAEFVKAQYKDTFDLEPENGGGYKLDICFSGLLTDHELEAISNQGANVVTRKLLGYYGLKFQVLMHADDSDFEMKA
jgi:hypothetical protein